MLIHYFNCLHREGGRHLQKIQGVEPREARATGALLVSRDGQRLIAS